LLGIGATEPASAATVTVVMTGELTAVDDSNDVTDGSLVIGVPYVLTMTYDDNASDRDPDSTFGDYVVVGSASSLLITVGNYAFDAGGDLVLGVLDGFYGPSEDTVGWFVDQFSSVGILDPGVTWAPFGYLNSALNDYAGDALDSDSLLTVNWSRGAYEDDDSAFYLFLEVLDPRTAGQDYIELRGTIDDIVTTVPEADPSWLLALTASLGLYRKRMLAPSR
jgi:hypothetical protein